MSLSIPLSLDKSLTYDFTVSSLSVVQLPPGISLGHFRQQINRFLRAVSGALGLSQIMMHGRVCGWGLLWSLLRRHWVLLSFLLSFLLSMLLSSCFLVIFGRGQQIRNPIVGIDWAVFWHLNTKRYDKCLGKTEWVGVKVTFFYMTQKWPKKGDKAKIRSLRIKWQFTHLYSRVFRFFYFQRSHIST